MSQMMMNMETCMHQVTTHTLDICCQGDGLCGHGLQLEGLPLHRLHNVGEGYEDDTAEHGGTVVGRPLPQLGHELEEGGNVGADGRSHPLDDQGEHVENLHLEGRRGEGGERGGG